MKSAITYMRGCGRVASNSSLGSNQASLKYLLTWSCKKRKVRIQVKKINPAEMPFAMLSQSAPNMSTVSRRSNDWAPRFDPYLYVKPMVAMMKNAVS